MFRKSPFSLPRHLYGGGRKRIFIALILLTCLCLCAGITLFFIVPWCGLFSLPVWLPAVSISFGIFSVFTLLWVCASLVFHIYTGLAFPGISGVRHAVVRIFLPFMEFLARILHIDRDMLRRSFIKVNNELVLAQSRHVEPRRLLVLLPHCVQRSSCPYRLVYNIDNCHRCGQCPVGYLLKMRDDYGFCLAIATGGTVARRIVVQTHPHCIIAVACERDLTSGIQDSYPVPVFGVLNKRPCGPCIDTIVSLSALENIVCLFLNRKSLAEITSHGLA
ncbi:MAG: DUF116 domain-containing protein [Desulfovibrio sp.]|nr:DUF116 domain-containing protein [Desulfovibrio sp.]